jgi:isocitrate dehydrogenase
MPNLYGDILSDVAAQIAGSVGLAGSSNIGEHGAMFEAIHGSAPRRAGQNLANPSGLLLGSVMMLVHIGQGDVAERVHNAWLKTIEDGIHTYDIFEDGVSTQKVGTKEFARAVVERVGQVPRKLKAVKHEAAKLIKIPTTAELRRPPAKKALVGVDVFLHHSGTTAEVVEAVSGLGTANLGAKAISTRGVIVWPRGLAETTTGDLWRCRFLASSGGVTVERAEVVELLGKAVAANLDVIKTENLYEFDGQAGYSMDQGQ